jgi:predicted ATPase
MLKGLHIQGFKSLRDSSVGLAPLTVVFGPNGPAKNNRHQPTCLPPDGMETLLQQFRPAIRLEAKISEPTGEDQPAPLRGRVISP